METAQNVINDALQELLVQADEQPIEHVDFERSKRYLNRLLAEMVEDGVIHGYAPINQASDTVAVPQGFINGIVYNLAVNLGTAYGVMVKPELLLKAQNSARIMRKRSTFIGPSSYPDSLPVGSGNEGDTTHHIQFYPEK